MSDFSVKNLIDMITTTYQSSNVPTALISSDCDVLWANSIAYKNFDNVANCDNIAKILSSTEISILRTKLQTNAPFVFSSQLVKYNFTPIFADDNARYFIANLEVNASTRLADLSEKDDVASILSYNFNTPLFRIFSTLTLLNRNLEMYENFEGLNLTKQITKDTYLSLRNSQNFSLFMCADTQLSNSNMVYGNFGKFIDEFCTTTASMMKRAGLPFSYSIIDEDIYTTFNRDELATALANIVLNAYKGLLSDDDNNISLDMNLNGDNITIKISDNGIGIPDDVLPSIFKPFFTHTTDGSDEPYKNGLGLGLYITKKIIEKHKGTIIVTSKEDEGTTVLISLPIKNNAPASDDLFVQNFCEDYSSNRFSPLYIQYAEIIKAPLQ